MYKMLDKIVYVVFNIFNDENIFFFKLVFLKDLDLFIIW